MSASPHSVFSGNALRRQLNLSVVVFHRSSRRMRRKVSAKSARTMLSVPSVCAGVRSARTRVKSRSGDAFCQSVQNARKTMSAAQRSAGVENARTALTSHSTNASFLSVPNAKKTTNAARSNAGAENAQMGLMSRGGDAFCRSVPRARKTTNAALSDAGEKSACVTPSLRSEPASLVTRTGRQQRGRTRRRKRRRNASRVREIKNVRMIAVGKGSARTGPRNR